MATYQDSRYNIALPSGAGGSLVLIKTITASSDSTISFVNGASDVVLDSTYRTYIFKIINAHPSSDGREITMNFSDDTSSHAYNLTKTTSHFRSYHNEGGTDAALGYIAGGDLALRESIEGAEDKTELAINDLDEHNIQRDDVIIGISTSGAAKYVQSALNHGSEIGCKTVYLICNREPYYSANVDLIIPINVGPEMITGSTRMKSGTATKLALNMISTTTMVKLGKIYGNLMVDLMAVNEKLVDRGIRIIQELTNLNYEDSNSILLSAEMSVKTAIVMTVKQCNLDEARRILERNNGILRDIID